MMKQFLLISHLLIFTFFSSIAQSLIIDDAVAANGSQVCVGVFAEDIPDMLSAQFTINYNADHLAYTGIQNFNLSVQAPNNNFSEPFPGFISFSWIADNLSTGYEVEPSEALFELCFDVQAEDITTSIYVTNAPVVVEMTYANLDLIDATFEAGEITIGAGGVFIDPVVFIPDAGFKADILEKSYDLNNDGELQESEAKGIFSLTAAALDIESLVGVEKFENLGTLKVYDNKLTSLDVSANSQLTILECQNNLLTSLTLGNGLDFLNCSQNSLESMILSSSPLMRILLCRGNMLTYLETSNLTFLEGLDASFNALDNIYLNNNGQLVNLDISDNTLEVLDISENPDLAYFDCSNNNIAELDLSQNPALREAYLSQNLLTSLDMNASVDLQKLYCGDNDINLLYLEENNELKILSCRNNQIASLSLEGKEDLFSLDCSGNLLPAINLGDSPVLGVLDCSSNSLADLDLNSNINISFLNCSNNTISDLQLNALENLRELDCSGNSLAELDLGDNYFLEKLDASSNLLEDADLGLNPSLIEINLSDNSLFTINLRNGTIAEEVYFSANEELNAVCVDNAELIFINTLINSYAYVNCSVYMDCSLINDVRDLAFSTIAVFPVPADDILNISSEEEIIDLEIIDSKGRSLRGLSFAKGTKRSNMFIGDLRSGVYLIQIHTRSGIFSQTFIKS